MLTPPSPFFFPPWSHTHAPFKPFVCRSSSGCFGQLGGNVPMHDPHMSNAIAQVAYTFLLLSSCFLFGSTSSAGSHQCSCQVRAINAVFASGFVVAHGWQGGGLFKLEWCRRGGLGGCHAAKLHLAHAQAFCWHLPGCIDLIMLTHCCR